MQDFGVLSSKTVTEVLMLEMKMSLGAKTFLVSGYPRNMRDVVEYSEKVSEKKKKKQNEAETVSMLSLPGWHRTH